MKILSLILLLCSFSAFSAGIKVDVDARNTNIKLRDSGNLRGVFAKWVKPSQKEQYLVYETPATTTWKDYKLSFIPSESGKLHINFRGSFAPKDKLQWILYRNLKIEGAKCNFTINPKDTDGNLKAAHAFYIFQNATVTKGQKVTLCFQAKVGQFGDRKTLINEVKKTPEKKPSPRRSLMKIDIDGRIANVDLLNGNIAGQVKGYNPKWLKGDLHTKYIVFEAPATDKWKNFKICLVPKDSGLVSLALRGSGAPKGKIQLTAYRDFKITGGTCSFAFDGKPTNKDGHVIAAHNLSVRLQLIVKKDQKVIITYQAKVDNFGDFSTIKNKAIKPKKYRLDSNGIALLALSDKGVKPNSISKLATKPNPKPPVAIFATPKNTKAPAVAKESFKVNFLEENGIARDANLSFGFPVPEKTLWNLNNIRLYASNGKAIPIQLASTAYWRDGSIKAVLVNFASNFKANESKNFTVEYGKDVKTLATKSAFKVSQKGNTLAISNSKISTVIDKNNFKLAGNVKYNNSKNYDFGPLVLVDEQGKKHYSNELPLEKLEIIDNGNERLIVKANGFYGKDKIGSFRAEITFFANSPKVDITVTHYNSNLKQEFTDITSLGFNLNAKGELIADGKKVDKVEIWDERAKASGTGKVNDLSFATIEARERYPKSLESSDNSIYFGILPKQPSKNYGKNMPHFLQFPFCEGYYRFKWGMGFSQEYKFDFSGKETPESLNAFTPVAVIDRTYLAKTKVFPGIVSSSDTRFNDWDKKAITALKLVNRKKNMQREYGFFNIGDWYGERGRNWGNNEYDTAHGLFMLFLRTGNRDVYRQALASARHQADTDIIHYYVDPYYVGANAQHGIGHTGISYQVMGRSTWTRAFDISYAGSNGHTWSGGMIDAWMLSGEKRVMDSALLLGEHLVNHIAPHFRSLGTHERSAGWSVKAILNLYAATADKRYLDAAKKILYVAFAEQNFKKGGAWPHPMPGAHAGGHKNTFGNCPYLIGILGGAINDYQKLTHDPVAKKSLISAAKWIYSAYHPEIIAWPYGASWDGKPYHTPAQNLNLDVSPAMIAGGILAGDKRFFEAGKDVLISQTVNGATSDAKSLSIELGFIPTLLEEIILAEKAFPNSKPYKYDSKRFLENTIKNATANYRLRGPNKKEMFVKLTSPTATLKLRRENHGAMPNKTKGYFVQVLDPQNRVIAKENLISNQPFTLDKKLSGKVGDIFKISIGDDMSGVWSILPSEGLESYIKLVPNTTFGHRSYAAFKFKVPAKTTKFSVIAKGVHPGTLALRLINPQSKIFEAAGSNISSTAMLPWLKYNEQDRIPAQIDIKRDASANDEEWTILFNATGDVALQFIGIPPYLCLIK